MNTFRPDDKQFLAEPITDNTTKKDVGEPVKFKLVGMRPKPTYESCGNSTLELNQKLLSWYEELEAHPHVQEVMNIPTDEPIFVMRSQDIYGAEAVEFWLGAAQRAVSPDKFQSAAERYKEMLEWQNMEPTRAKIPD